MKRMLCLLLALVMILGILPAGVLGAETAGSASETETDSTHGPIEVDFKAFAKQASKQTWWDELPSVTTTDGYETKRIGTAFRTAATAEEKAAFRNSFDWRAMTEQDMEVWEQVFKTLEK